MSTHDRSAARIVRGRLVGGGKAPDKIPASDSAAQGRPLDFGELWARSNPPIISDSLLNRLIHDAEVEAGWGDDPDECMVTLNQYTEGVVSALRELRERRSRV